MQPPPYQCLITLTVLVVLISALTTASAQAPRSGLTLVEAIDVALATSPVLRAAQHQVEAASAGVEQARAAFFPRLDVSESFTYADNPVFAFSSKLNQGRFAEADFDVRRLNNPGATRNFKTSLSVAQPLYTGGKASLGLEQARLQRQASTLGLDRQQQEVVFQVARAYYGVLRAQSALAVVGAAMRAAEANRDLARVRFETGLVVQADVLSAAVRLAGLHEQEITATHHLTLAKAALNDVMGQPLDTLVEVVGELTQRPGRYAPLQGLEALALEKRPDYHQTGVTEQALERHIALARAAYLPTVDVSASYEVHTRDLVAQGQESWYVTLGLQWNLFHGFADRARVAEAQANVARLKALRAGMASKIGLEVKEASLGLQAARQRIDVATGAIAQAEESLRMTRDRYQTGLTTIVDLLFGEAALTRAQGNRTAALYDYNVALASVEFALGTISREAF